MIVTHAQLIDIITTALDADTVEDLTQQEINDLVRTDWRDYDETPHVAFLIAERYSPVTSGPALGIALAEVLGEDAKEAVVGCKEEGLGVSTYAIFPHLICADDA